MPKSFPTPGERDEIDQKEIVRRAIVDLLRWADIETLLRILDVLTKPSLVASKKQE